MAKIISRQLQNAEETLGQFIGKEYYDLLVTEDTDFYSTTIDGKNDESNIVFKFRKNVFTKEEQDLAYEGLRAAATESQNRGLAAGPRGDTLGAANRGHRDWVTTFHHEILDYLLRDNHFDDQTIESIVLKHSDNKSNKEETRGQVWLRSAVIKDGYNYDTWFSDWLEEVKQQDKKEQKLAAEYVASKYISETNYAQSVMSGIGGYFDRYPRIPYGRATSYTEKHPEDFAKAFPFFRKLNDEFAKLLPNRWKNQKVASDSIDPNFLICNTVFTTCTVNHNWRTACHRDAGDLASGFSNICGFTGPDNLGWKGAELILPEWRVGIDLRPGDLLLVANHTGIHGNAALEGEANDRLTVVSYFREKMLELKSWDYEQLRKKFVTERSRNKEHKLWRPLWNGVSPSCFESEEWYQYLKDHNMPDPYEKNNETLEDFFS